MSYTATVLEAEFRSRGYTESERLLLREVLGEFGAVRLRPLDLPEAGGSTELYVAMAFIGTSVVSGLVGHLTGKTFDKFSAGLLRFFRSRKQRDNLEPEMTLRVSYDDVDLDIGPVDDADLSRVPELAGEIHRQLTSGTLKDLPVSRIVIGMVKLDDEWSEPHLWDRSDEGQRFWGVSLEGHQAVTHILDTQTALLAPFTRRAELSRGSDAELG